MRFFIILISLLLLSCDNDNNFGNTFVSSELDEVELRIHNETVFTMNEVTIRSGGEEFNYGKVLAKTKSSVKKFEKVYPFFDLKFNIGDKNFEYIPQSFDGYHPVENARYDVKIYDVDTVKLTFSFRLEED